MPVREMWVDRKRRGRREKRSPIYDHKRGGNLALHLGAKVR